VVLAPNLRVGVAALRVLVRRLAGVLGEGFDVEIVEVHHGGKRDAPSGTALALASAVSEGRGFSGGPVVDRAVRGRPREVGGVGVSVVRGGGVVGDHTVHFLGREERIELTHRAADRRVFARGAVRAARWVVGRPPGRHGMEEVLGLGAPDRVRG
jgi:4-hydroxy-tetrahydrodipicolinate reductase